MEKRFAKYDPKELIGKRVLYSYGASYDKKLSRAIRTIVRVTPGGFIEISETSNILFRQSGIARGYDDFPSAIRNIELISDEEYKSLVAEFREVNDKLDILKFIDATDISEFSLEKLHAIKEILSCTEEQFLTKRQLLTSFENKLCFKFKYKVPMLDRKELLEEFLKELKD